MGPRVTGVAIAAILVVSSCTLGGQPHASASPSSSPSVAIPTPGQIAWSSCGGGFQCGTLAVPLDYAHPDRGSIDLALIRKPATVPSQRVGSLLTNPGGPGASGIEFLRGEAAALANLNQRFDLIGFDPRGVGQSSPVRCLSASQEDAFNALDGVLDDPQEKQAVVQADKGFAAGCQQLSGQVLPFVDTVSVARDMDVMRSALGDASLTYLGFSYGTFLGEMYAHLFPTHVRALALDGVVDPALSANDLLLAQVRSFDRNIQAFLADCNARKNTSSRCAYAQSGDPATKLNALMARLDTNPLPVGGRLLTRALAVTGVGYALYDQSFWPYLDQALTLADRGRGEVLLALADLYNERKADGSYSNANDVYYAIACLDRPAATDLAAYDQLGAAFAKASPLFGPSFQYGFLPCAYWPAKPTGHPGPLTAVGAPPILLVGGTNDPATPYAWAQSVNQQIAGSVLLTRQGNGHTSYDSSPCAHRAIDTYLIDLTLPAPGTVCT